MEEVNGTGPMDLSVQLDRISSAWSASKIDKNKVGSIFFSKAKGITNHLGTLYQVTLSELKARHSNEGSRGVV